MLVLSKCDWRGICASQPAVPSASFLIEKLDHRVRRNHFGLDLAFCCNNVELGTEASAASTTGVYSANFLPKRSELWGKSKMSLNRPVGESGGHLEGSEPPGPSALLRFSGPKFFAGGSDSSSSSEPPSPTTPRNGERSSSEESGKNLLTMAFIVSTPVTSHLVSFSVIQRRAGLRRTTKVSIHPLKNADSLQSYRREQAAGIRLFE